MNEKIMETVPYHPAILHICNTRDKGLVLNLLIYRMQLRHEAEDYLRQETSECWIRVAQSFIADNIGAKSASKPLQRLIDDGYITRVYRRTKNGKIDKEASYLIHMDKIVADLVTADLQLGPLILQKRDGKTKTMTWDDLLSNYPKAQKRKDKTEAPPKTEPTAEPTPQQNADNGEEEKGSNTTTRQKEAEDDKGSGVVDDKPKGKRKIKVNWKTEGDRERTVEYIEALPKEEQKRALSELAKFAEGREAVTSSAFEWWYKMS